MQSVTSIEDAESFMLKHGESIVDTLGGEVDRIEKNLKVQQCHFTRELVCFWFHNPVAFRTQQLTD